MWRWATHSCCGGSTDGAEDETVPSSPEECPHQTASGIVLTADHLKQVASYELVAPAPVVGELGIPLAVPGLEIVANHSPPVDETASAPPRQALYCRYII